MGTAGDLLMARPVPKWRGRRRERTAAAAVICLATLVLLAGEGPARIPLHSRSVALGADGVLRLVAPDQTPNYVAGTRVAVGGTVGLAQAQLDWVASGWDPRRAGLPADRADMAYWALVDLKTLLLADGAQLAAASPAWHHVWPRDASFAAVAFAASGHLDDAAAVLTFLDQAEHEDGVFAARYHPDGTPVADGREPQLDGCGWVLWALDQVAGVVGSELGPAEARQLVARFAALRDRSVAAILAALEEDGLPGPSPDYWERREHELTLGVAAPLLAGLQSAGRLYQLQDPDNQLRIPAAEAAITLSQQISVQFGPDFHRYRGSEAADSAVAMLMQPFVSGFEGEAEPAWAEAQVELSRAGGGLAPGAAWKRDGVSWTPETALFAYTAAAAGDWSRAEGWLYWLADHRTADGALPEKVLANGEPASAAPLAWTCALVILTERTLAESR